MKKNDFDNKLFVLLILRKWKTVVACTILGALLVGIPYILSKTVIGNFDYRCEIMVHVEYGEDSAGNMYDYINYYTWNQWVTSDKFVDVLFSRYDFKNICSKEDIKQAVKADIKSDPRVVEFMVDTDNPKKTSVIGAAVWDSIIELMDRIPEIKSAEIINITEPFKFFVYDNRLQAFVFGGIWGFFLSVFALWLIFLLDDSVYIPELFEKKYGINLSQEMGENELEIGRTRPDMSVAEKEVDLVIECNAHNGKIIEYVFHECEKRKIKIKNIRLSNIDENLVEAYYRGSSFPNPFLKDK